MSRERTIYLPVGHSEAELVLAEWLVLTLNLLELQVTYSVTTRRYFGCES